MTFWHHTRALLTTKDLKLWHMIVGFFAATIVSTAGNYEVAQFNEHRQLVTAQRVAQLAEFLKAADDFDELSGEYLGKMARSDLADGKIRLALESNIRKQNAYLDNADEFLTDAQSRQTAVYRNDLLNLKGALDRTRDSLSGGPFAQALADTLLQRREVVRTLRRAAGINSKRDEQRSA